MSRAAAYLSALLYVVEGRFEGRKERGATAVEYGLMVGLIAIAIIAAVGLLSGSIQALFTRASVALNGAGV